MQTISISDAAYPALLKNISNPPPLLYVSGEVACLNAPQIAIVGSRTPSALGLDIAAQLAQQLAGLGLIITSGLARGIDQASHRGALAATHGKTIAVLGHGIDIIYPPQHINLARKITNNGCLVSEFPIGTAPYAGNFPKRNRIISGLSRGVVVVEAALNSGSLITARFAVEQNREVFAVPGSIRNTKTQGCHKLIRQGAKLVECIDDILEELVGLLNFNIHDKSCNGKDSRLKSRDLTATQQQVLDFIDYDSTYVDAIVGRSGLETRAVSSVLLELELHGLIAAVPGGYARKSD